jgi:hypothetical protein
MKGNYKMTPDEGRRASLLKQADEIDKRAIFTKEWRVLPDADRWAWSGAVGIETVEPEGVTPQHVCFSSHAAARFRQVLRFFRLSQGIAPNRHALAVFSNAPSAPDFGPLPAPTTPRMPLVRGSCRSGASYRELDSKPNKKLVSTLPPWNRIHQAFRLSRDISKPVIHFVLVHKLPLAVQQHYCHIDIAQVRSHEFCRSFERPQSLEQRIAARILRLGVNLPCE